MDASRGLVRRIWDPKVDDCRGWIRPFTSVESCIKFLTLLAERSEEMCLRKPLCALSCARLLLSARWA